VDDQLWARRVADCRLGERAVAKNNCFQRGIADGFFETPDKKLGWVVTEEEFFDYAKAMLRSADTLLFGRATYEHMASHWPSAPQMKSQTR
jgi:dihydrofolate reductase